MATAKRLYLYSVSGIGMGLLLYAATILMGLLFDNVGLGSSLPFSAPSGVQANRELLSLAIGLVVVGLPLWLFHWALVERMVSGDGTAAALERQSIVRAVYFGLVLLVLVSQLAQSSVDVLREAIVRPLGATGTNYPASLSGALAGLVAYLGAFVYHAWIRATDIRQGPTIKGAAAWGSRLFHYWLAIGLMVGALYAVGTAITTTVQALTGGGNALGVPSTYYYGVMPLAASSAPWWVYPIVGAVASAVVYGVLWLAYWRYAVGIAARLDQQGADERASRVRLTYFVLVVASLVSYSLLFFSQALGLALQYVVGSRHVSPSQPLWAEILALLLATLPMLAGWWWHRRRAAREWAAQPSTVLRAIRPLDYFTSLIGLAVFGAALAMFIAAIVQEVTGLGLGAMSADAWRTGTVGTIAVMAVAAPIWLWPWLAGQRRLTIDPLGETRSTARKAFLFAIGGATVIAGAGSLAFILYRLTRIAVGLEGSGLGADVRMPLCVLAVAAGFLAYHAYWIRRDQSVGVQVGEKAQQAVTVGTVVSVHELVVVGPAGADLEALRASLAERLPDGFTIVVRPREGTA